MSECFFPKSYGAEKILDHLESDWGSNTSMSLISLTTLTATSALVCTIFHFIYIHQAQVVKLILKTMMRSISSSLD